MTILSSYLFFIIILTITSSQPLLSPPQSPEYVLLNTTLTLSCTPSTTFPYIVWEYSPSLDSFSRGQSFIIAIGGTLDLSKGSLRHLVPQIRENSENNDLLITPIDLSANGVYSCRGWKSQQLINIYNVQVVSKPQINVIKDDDSGDNGVVVAGMPQQFRCDVTNAEPIPVVSWYLNGENISSDELSSTTTTDDATQLKTVKSTISITPEISENMNVKCVASHPAYSPVETAPTAYQVQYPPQRPQVTNFKIIGNSEEYQIMVCDKISAVPTPDVEWIFEQSMVNYTSAIHDRLSFQNLPLSFNGTRVTCVVRNAHGEARNSVEIVVLKQSAKDKLVQAVELSGGEIRKSESSTTMGSNTILMIGVIVAAIVLAVLGGIVTWKRCSHRADYNTREDQKQSGPDGINYEQEENEALAPGEEKQQKELLM